MDVKFHISTTGGNFGLLNSWCQTIWSKVFSQLQAVKNVFLMCISKINYLIKKTNTFPKTYLNSENTGIRITSVLEFKGLILVAYNFHFQKYIIKDKI